MRRSLSLAALAVLATAAPASAQDRERDWSFTASALLYVAAEPSFLLPIVTADRGALHLEGRWNYEDLETASAWVGWAFETGRDWQLTLVPMVGAVFGRSDGVAPGVELTIGWRAFELYSESELVLALDEGTEDYFYTWNQLTWAPLAGLSVGVSGQRLLVAGTDRLIDVGPMATAQVGPLELQAFVYNPFSDEAFTVLGTSIAF